MLAGIPRKARGVGAAASSSKSPTNVN